ncbi:hypothetical protein CKO15_05420 [Halorhodospira abdelmalekii]|uniref:secretin N-terminal domain-containing protein n=1 Tax=Halorhodospira abdelmalekii TaxID=421629 RepID=UPI0019042AED|nr:secretin N-terminal domain-containing protein [Halorhodospira abdelmalekii]MBK1734735.1 hypothetical protein [Halorhodospira abdelmalekii]
MAHLTQPTASPFTLTARTLHLSGALLCATALSATLLGKEACATSPLAWIEGETDPQTPLSDPFFGKDEKAAPPIATPTPTLHLRTIALQHSDAESLAQLLDETGLLAEAGRSSVDARTNTLILRALPTDLEAAAALIAELDRATRQVMIEARIVLVSGDYSLELGSRLGFERIGGDGQLWAASGPLLANLGPGSGDGLLAELPQIGGGQLGVAVGKIGERLLQLELSAMEAEGHGQIVSSPRVLTTERREARIEQGVQIPYQETTESGATAIAFRDAALSLTATPTVSDDGSIALSLHITKDSVGQIFSGVPSIDTQTVTTHLRVDHGETVVLGGVREREHYESRQQVPWLARLPLLGHWFRQRHERSREQELLIFVTPLLIDSALKSGAQ